MASILTKLNLPRRSSTHSPSSSISSSSSSSLAAASSSSSLPPFLAVPLASPAVLEQLCTTLAQREQSRMVLAAHYHADRQRSSPTASPKPEDAIYAMHVGLSPKHVKKNRYTDIVAYDKTRIILPHPRRRSVPTETGAAAANGVNGSEEPVEEVEEEEEEEEYVNASLVQEPDLGFGDKLPRRWWVAAQAPISSTLHAFLSLLLSPPNSLSTSSSPTPPPPFPLVSLIVQLTPLKEQRRDKCHPYFPQNIGETWDVACPVGGQGKNKGIWVRLDEKEVLHKEVKRVSKLRVGWEGDEDGREVTHVEYLGWGDHGVPSDPTELLTFMKTTDHLNTSLSSSPTTPRPILIHCSAGVGRTGTYITISSLLPLLSHLKSSPPTPPLPSPSALLPPTFFKRHSLKAFHTPPFLLNPQSPTSPLSSMTNLPPYPSSQFSPNLPRDYVGETIDALREQRCTMVQNNTQVKWVFTALEKAWEML